MKLVTNQLLIACAATLLATSATSLAGSLWVNENNNERSMFADKIARDIGDTVTIIVDEKTTINQDALLDTKDTATGAFGLGPNITGLLQGFLAALPAAIGRASGGTFQEEDFNVPEIGTTSEGTWNAGGTTRNSLTVYNPGATVTVVDVLPNGNLVVEGAKIIRTANENQYGYLRGIIRPIDIAGNNTISSTQVADAQVEFIPEGELTDVQKKGWLMRAWNKIKPF